MGGVALIRLRPPTAAAAQDAATCGSPGHGKNVPEPGWAPTGATRRGGCGGCRLSLPKGLDFLC